MDPLALVGGIVAVGQASHTICKVARTLYKISYGAGSISEEVASFASHVDIFGFTVTDAHSSIRNHYMSFQEAKSFRRYQQHGTLRKLAAHVKYLMQKIKAILPKLRGRQGRLKFITRFQWVRGNEERSGLCASMDRIQLSFLLILQHLTFEALQRSAANPPSVQQELYDFKQEIQNHKSLMRNQMKTMRILRDRQERFRPKDSEDDSGDEIVSIDDMEQEILTMGDELLDPKPSTTRSSRARSTTVSRLSKTRSKDIMSDPTLGREHNRNVVSSTSHNVLRERPGYLERNPIGALNGPPQRRPIPRVNQEPNPPSPSLPVTPSRNVQPLDLGSPASQATHPSESDYMAVQPIDDLLRLDSDQNVVIQGYINNDHKPTNALMNDIFPVNVISQFHATNLGLETEYFYPTESKDGNSIQNAEVKMAVDFGNGGQQTVIGRTSFGWASVPGRSFSKPLRLVCYVCESVPFQTPLILGKPYAGKKKHYGRVL
ncbi:hypothetical protein BGZ60DRAFT_528584 [Tricladium varicosporioides]|nr:hypothetical protein BGZ60DRAFT_528584 [Hymenoscyphus varicosporioides]